METTIGYIVIFGLGLLFAVFYLFGKEKQRMLPIAQQTYPQLQLNVLITKEKRAVTSLILELRPLKNNLPLDAIALELTDKQHNKKSIRLNPYLLEGKSSELVSGKKSHFILHFDDFLKELEAADFPFETFRLVAVTRENKKFKSHILGYHPRWGIYKADSGNYN